MLYDLEKLQKLTFNDSILKELIRVDTSHSVSYKGIEYPLYSFSLGTQNSKAPVLFVTGGIHGLERIGSQLAWSFLKSSIDRMIWDKSLQQLLENVRIVFLPLVNPIGYYHSTRSNGRGVDLMRNSPIESKEKVPFLLGGHRFSNKIPWYRGEVGILEKENQFLIQTFHKEASESNCVVAVDFHSGFGLRDRLWFPYSSSKTPFEDLPHLHALFNLFSEAHPYHVYHVEPQTHSYSLHGDVWDYLYLEHKTKNPEGVFIPFTLEMGSWSWVRKNPWQLFSLHGPFNPIKEHRVKRTYRRHHLLFDFILKALYSHPVWNMTDPVLKYKHQQLALEKWYGK